MNCVQLNGCCYRIGSDVFLQAQYTAQAGAASPMFTVSAFLWERKKGNPNPLVFLR